MLKIRNMITINLIYMVVFSMATTASEASDKKIESEETLSSKPFTEAKDISDSNKNENSLEEGLILNRTMTRLGYNFYREFVSSYRDIGGINEHSGLTVVEQPTARSGSKITILHNRKPIFITFISPVSRYIYAQAGAAAKRIDLQLKQAKDQTKWTVFENPDLATEEY